LANLKDLSQDQQNYVKTFLELIQKYLTRPTPQEDCALLTEDRFIYWSQTWDYALYQLYLLLPNYDFVNNVYTKELTQEQKQAIKDYLDNILNRRFPIPLFRIENTISQLWGFKPAKNGVIPNDDELIDTCKNFVADYAVESKTKINDQYKIWLTPKSEDALDIKDEGHAYWYWASTVGAQKLAKMMSLATAQLKLDQKFVCKNLDGTAYPALDSQCSKSMDICPTRIQENINKELKDAAESDKIKPNLLPHMTIRQSLTQIFLKRSEYENKIAVFALDNDAKEDTCKEAYNNMNIQQNFQWIYDFKKNDKTGKLAMYPTIKKLPNTPDTQADTEYIIIKQFFVKDGTYTLCIADDFKWKTEFKPALDQNKQIKVEVEQGGTCFMDSYAIRENLPITCMAKDKDSKLISENSSYYPYDFIRREILALGIKKEDSMTVKDFSTPICLEKGVDAPCKFEVQQGEDKKILDGNCSLDPVPFFRNYFLGHHDRIGFQYACVTTDKISPSKSISTANLNPLLHLFQGKLTGDQKEFEANILPTGSIIGACTTNGLESGDSIEVNGDCALQDNSLTKAAPITGIPAISMNGKCQVLKKEHLVTTLKYLEELLNKYKDAGFKFRARDWLIITSLLPMLNDSNVSFKGTLEIPSFDIKQYQIN